MLRILLLITGTLLTFSFSAFASTPKDTLVVAVPLDGIISFDPAESFETISSSSLRNLYQTLVEPDKNNQRQLAPLLARSWQQGSTPQSLIFSLNPEARFVSGNPVTAQDVVFSLTRAVQLNKAPSFILAEFGWTAENIASQFHIISDRQLEIRWPAPIGQDLALRLLSAPVSSIVDRTVALQHASNNDTGNGWLKNHSAGSGAFSIKQFIPLQALVLDASPHASPAPHVKRVLFKGVADASSRRLLIQQGDVDVALQLGPDQLAALKGDQQLQIVRFPSSLIYYLAFNTHSQVQPTLGNPALWQAARWLVDYDAIASQLLKGEYRIHQSFLPVGFDGALTSTPFHYDLAKARQILQQGGIQPGTHISLTVVNQPPYIDVAQALQASFAKADIHLDLQPVVEAEQWGKMRSRDFQAIFTYWGADYIDPNTNASTFAYNVKDGPKTLAWRVGWDIPALSAETRRAASESDPAQRRVIYGRLQTEVQQNSPFVTILQGAQQIVARKNISHIEQGIELSVLRLDEVQK